MTEDRRRDVARLSSCTGPLVQEHDVVMFDLDGVIYRGPDPVPGVAAHVERLRADGTKTAFVTNNASRTPDAVAEKLRGMGVPAEAADVVTSAQAVARLMAERLPRGVRVLAVGDVGLTEALQEQGLEVVRRLADGPAAVVQGFGNSVDWTALAEAAHAVNSGLPWFASNTDRTIPTARGTAPGNGMLVAAVRAAVQVDPVVAGKPEPALFDETVRRVGGRRPLVVGDRLDTDIEGANRVGAQSLLVLTGVNGLADLASADPAERPGYVSPTLDGLFRPHPPMAVDDATVACAGWSAQVVDGQVRAERTAGGASLLGLVRAAVGMCWQHGDRTGEVPGLAHVLEQVQALEVETGRTTEQ